MSTATKIEAAKFTATELNFLNNLFAVEATKTETKKFSAKLSNETLTLLTELDIIENGTAIYRFFQMACKAKKRNRMRNVN